MSDLGSLFVAVATTILAAHDGKPPQILVNPGFEQVIGAEWTCQGCTGSRIADAHSGNASFIAAERTSTWDGPEQVLQLGSAISGGHIYHFSGYAKVLPSLSNQRPQRLVAGVNYTLPGARSTSLPISTVVYIEPADGWVLLETEFYTLKLNQTVITLGIFYADPGVDFQVDTLSIVEIGEAYSDDVDILNNPGFENPIGGSGWYCWGFCTETRVNDSHTGSWAFKVSNREQYWQGPLLLTSIGSRRFVGSHVYQFTGYVKVLQSLPDQLPQNFTAYLHYRTLAVVHIGYVNKVLPADGWVLLETEFYVWDDFTLIDFYISGPDPGVDFIVDTFSIVETGATFIEPGDSVLRNAGFETLIEGSGWLCYRSCGQALVNDSHSGNTAYKAFNRYAYWNGPAQYIPSARISADRLYQFRGYIKVLQSLADQRPQIFSATIDYTTIDDSDVKFGIAYAHRVEPADGWVLMEAEFRTPNNGEGALRLTINGPDAGIEFLVDTLSITESG